jgi:ligand-binding sensor domain-containing protein
VDSDNHYWISTSDGISIYHAANQYYQIHPLPAMPEYKEQDPMKIFCLAQTDTTFLWLGTNKGLFQYFLSDQKLSAHSLTNQKITALLADGPLLYVAVNDKVIAWDLNRKKVTRQWDIEHGIQFLQRAKDGLWVGTWSLGLYHVDLDTDEISRFQKTIDTSSSLLTNSLITSYADDQLMWIGYNGGYGFSAIDLEKKSFRHYHPPGNEIIHSKSGTITAILLQDEVLWLGSHGGGIFRYHPQTTTFENFQQDQGLCSNYVNNIIADTNENLWIATADGINYYDQQSQVLRRPEIPFVLRSNEYSNCGIRGINQHLFFYNQFVILEINPADYKVSSTFPKLLSVSSGFLISR